MSIIYWAKFALSLFSAVKDPDKLQALALAKLDEIDLESVPVALQVAVINTRPIVADVETWRYDYNLVADLFADGPEKAQAKLEAKLEEAVGKWGDGAFLKSLMEFLKTIDWVQIIKIFVTDREKTTKMLEAIDASDDARELFCSAVAYELDTSDDDESKPASEAWKEARAQSLCMAGDEKTEMDPFTILLIISTAIKFIKFWRDRRANR